MIDGLTLDYLPNREDMKIYQHPKMFRINTDTCLLGEFLSFPPGKRVLDIGTNNGVLLLYASLHSPSYMCGIDINKEALSIAKINMDHYNFSATLLNIDAKYFHSREKFDVIVANPPYFSSHIVNQNEYLAMARHEIYLPLNILFESVSLNLTDDGVFYFVHLASREEEIKKVLQQFGFRIKRLKYIYDINKKNANGLLLETSKVYNGDIEIDEPIIIKR